MSEHYDFPVRWHQQVMAKALTDRNKYTKLLAGLKNKGTPYYRAHEVVAQMYAVAYEALKKFPEPEPDKEART